MTESELLFTGVLKCSRTDLYLNKNILLNKDEQSIISNVLKRRIEGEPIQYILGETEFMGLNFKVGPDVLIPRQETEILVETAIKFGSRLSGSGSRLRVLDIGTGSGCIAVSLVAFIGDIEVTATDISREALEIAQYNAEVNNVNEKIKFINTDLFPRINCFKNDDLEQPKLYDIIVSNPPYISCEDIDKLQPEIKYEPRIALEAGKDGLDFYRKIIPGAADYLRGNGFLIMEMGFNQREGIENIFRRTNGSKFGIIEIIKDYNNIDRVIIAGLL